MSTSINQKEYLKKYLSGPSKDKKKKKKKSTKGHGLQIIDDDIDLSKLRPLDGDELDILGEGEDAPQVAGIIDERPEEIKKLEQYNSSSKWRVINQDDGFNSKLQIEEIKKDRKQQEKENEIVFGKMYSDSEDDKKNDSDISPPRKKAEKPSQNDKNSDISPSRLSSHAKRKKNYDSDISPPRKSERIQKERKKPSRWGDERPKESSPHRKKSSPNRDRKKNYDSDQSPPRKSRRDEEQSTRHKKNNDSDASPPRKTKKDRRQSDSDASPPRKRKSDKRHNSDSDASPPRNSKKDKRQTDSNASPPRRMKNRERSTEIPKNSKRQKSPDYEKRKRTTTRGKNRNNSDSDLSPPRKSNKSKRQKSPDSDVSPPRKDRRNSDSPPPTNKKMAKTLEGKLAGLQDAVQLRKENEAFRKREEEVFRKMTDEVSGKNATVMRRSGKRETSEERRKLKEKAERQKELDEKYKKWSKGVKQVEAQEARYKDYIHEASKPLARFEGDKDLEATLKDIQRDGDPMAGYMREKKRCGMPEKPMYKGSFAPNRFNIRPGYRWDGVDRSNGYEKKYFETQSKKKAEEEEYYKWSSADM